MTTSAEPDRPQPRSPVQRFGLGLLGVVALVAAVWLTQAEFILVTDEQNGEFPASPFTLREDDFHHPRLELLRRRERLDDVVAGARTQFETIVRLRAWARRQGCPGTAAASLKGSAAGLRQKDPHRIEPRDFSSEGCKGEGRGKRGTACPLSSLRSPLSYHTIASGFSSSVLNVLRNAEPVAPSMTR